SLRMAAGCAPQRRTSPQRGFQVDRADHARTWLQDREVRRRSGGVGRTALYESLSRLDPGRDTTARPRWSGTAAARDSAASRLEHTRQDWSARFPQVANDARCPALVRDSVNVAEGDRRIPSSAGPSSARVDYVSLGGWAPSFR